MAHRVIENGSKINFCLDTWLDEPIVDKYNIPKAFHKNIIVMVKDWLVDKVWCILANIQIAYPNLIPIIFAVTIPNMEIEDNIIWKDSIN